MGDPHNYLLAKPEPVRSCLLAMRDIVLAQGVEVTETVKYGMPCFCYRGKAFCYLWADKITGEPYLLMVEGKYLTHPHLEQGDRTRMKILRVNPRKDLPIRTIKTILKAALDLYRKGVLKAGK